MFENIIASKKQLIEILTQEVAELQSLDQELPPADDVWERALEFQGDLDARNFDNSSFARWQTSELYDAGYSVERIKLLLVRREQYLKE